MNVLALIQRLRQASDSPQLVEKAFEEAPEDDDLKEVCVAFSCLEHGQDRG